MFARSKILTSQLAINTGGAVVAGDFYFPNPVRILRYFAIPKDAAQAAHSTVVVKVEFFNKGTAGAGTTLLATLTNDSDEAATTILKSAAWVQADALEINTQSRPVSAYATDVADEIAAGEVIGVTVTGAGSTPTANVFIVGVEYIDSD